MENQLDGALEAGALKRLAGRPDAGSQTTSDWSALIWPNLIRTGLT